MVSGIGIPKVDSQTLETQELRKGKKVSLKFKRGFLCLFPKKKTSSLLGFLHRGWREYAEEGSLETGKGGFRSEAAALCM